MLWRQNHLQNGWGRRRFAVALHSLTSGLFLPFLVVYGVQAGHLSLMSAGAALLLGVGTAKLGPVGVRAMRQGAHPRFPALGDHDDAHELPDHITDPEVGDLDGERRVVRDSKDPADPALTLTVA